jgi:DivIVA domain-containing protein
VARRIGEAVAMTGDEIRDIWFSTTNTSFFTGATTNVGYDGSEVDDLLRRVAAELDADKTAGPLIESATFQKPYAGYDIDAVDWFLDQLLLHPDHTEPDGTSADPWREVDVVQLVRGGISSLAERYPRSKPTRKEARKWFAGQCQNAWHDFGQQPGTHLRCVNGQLGTAEQQTLASLLGRGPDYGWGRGPETVSLGGRIFTFQKMHPAQSSRGVADIAARSRRDGAGHFAAAAMKKRKQQGQSRVMRQARGMRELVDEMGNPILYTSGEHFNWRAWACVSFPDGRWLRFPVRGTRRANAIMTAVDQAGNKVARYRIAMGSSLWESRLAPSKPVEITVNPGWELTDEVVLTIAISARLLARYFNQPS